MNTDTSVSVQRTRRWIDFAFVKIDPSDGLFLYTLDRQAVLSIRYIHLPEERFLHPYSAPKACPMDELEVVDE